MTVSRQLYEDMILDHNRAPRNFMRIPQGPLCNAHGFNPICGDDFNIYLQVENNIIKDASFNGSGCAISTASASLMTEAVRGMSVTDARELFSESSIWKLQVPKVFWIFRSLLPGHHSLFPNGTVRWDPFVTGKIAGNSWRT